MRSRNGTLDLAAGDLGKHLACKHLTELDRAKAEGRLQPPSWNNPMLDRLIARGFAHEAAYAAYLEANGRRVVTLKGLEDAISVDVVDPLLDSRGWSFEQNTTGATGDRIGGRSLLREVYLSSAPDYEGAITVPVLWDRKSETIINNESSEIIRIQNSEFDDVARHPEIDLYPELLRTEIDALNDWIYPEINNGVYRCGFARKQQAYSDAVQTLFVALDRVEAILERSRYLCGDRLTEADVRLFTTLVRFDPVYVTHFKCNVRRLVDYPNLWGYTRDIFQLPGLAETVNLEHIKHHYFESHRHINPFGIVPTGPEVDFTVPHDRGS